MGSPPRGGNTCAAWPVCGLGQPCRGEHRNCALQPLRVSRRPAGVVRGGRLGRGAWSGSNGWAWAGLRFRSWADKGAGQARAFVLVSSPLGADCHPGRAQYVVIGPVSLFPTSPSFLCVLRGDQWGRLTQVTLAFLRQFSVCVWPGHLAPENTQDPTDTPPHLPPLPGAGTVSGGGLPAWSSLSPLGSGG